jgi:carboxymethylenebutenolidase
MTNFLYFSPLFWLMMVFTPAVEKEPMTHCGTMKQWANDPEFQAAHLSPEASENKDFKGKKIVFSTPDGKEASGYIIEAKKKSNKWLFVYQEWWGLNDYIRTQSDTFYGDLGEEVNVLALDMYDGAVATDAKEAGKLMSEAKDERLENIIKGALNRIGPKAQVASVGWCFGGGLSLKSGLISKKQNVGVVMYYGMPVKDVNQLKTLSSDVLGIFATEQWISKEVVEEFDKNMKSANKKLTYKIFSGVHGFANPSNPKYDKEQTAEAYAMALNYLKARLKVK